jgi:TolB-like protein/rhodanese-related sulfurtransferase/Flp pilus assembly protein TadD
MATSLAMAIERLRESLASTYDIERELGHGGMSVVLLAHDRKHDRVVAIKVLHPELAASLGPDRFLREIRLAARLSHPHILPLFDSGEVDGVLYYVMPFVEGESLRERLDREKQLSVEESVRHGCAIASALDYAARHGVVHRDVKPENVMINEGVAMVTDFGIAKAESPGDAATLTQVGMMIGTPAYVSPEQVTGESSLDGRSDQYSLACVVYEMLSGERPFKGGSAHAVMAKRLTETARPLRAIRSAVPESIERAVARAMSTNPDLRFSSSAQFAQALASGAMPTPGDTRVLAADGGTDTVEVAANDNVTDGAAGAVIGGGRRAAASTRTGWLAVGLVALLAVAGTVAWLSQARTARVLPANPVAAVVAEKPSLAVLPFASLDASADNAYFADGMTDDIITDLSRLSGVLVVARNSSWSYKGKAVKVQQVAEELGVRYVLEGSVRREGGIVRINAQLADARSGRHLWAERYDGPIEDVFALQDKVVGQIVAALAVELTQDEQARLGLAETANPKAYDAFLRGWALYRQANEDDTHQAIALFEQAVALDPGYARAHAALAAAEWRLVQSSWESTTQGGYQRAYDRMQLALAAAKKQPSALAHAVTAELLSKQGNYDESFAEIDRALALAPNDPDTYLSKARILIATGHAAEAGESVRWAMRLDPMYSPDALRTLAISLFHQQRYEEARQTFERVLALGNDNYEDYTSLIATLGHLGRKDGVAAAIAKFDEASLGAGYNALCIQYWGTWWWYGDLFNYDPAYRDQVGAGLRKAGVPECAGNDLSLDDLRAIMHKRGGFYEIDGATTIDAPQAKALRDRGVRFVDVRAAKGFAGGHIPGAHNLDVAAEFSRETLARIAGKDEELVLSCHGRTCPDSAYASAKAVLWGYKRVYYFAGGFPAWQEAGYPVEVGVGGSKGPTH